MKSLFKILLWIVAGFVGVVVLASVVIWLFFDPNEYRDEIAAAVKQSTGRDLVIEGDLSLSIFPWLAIEVGRTELGNAQGFGDEPFMRFDEASLSIRLLPLILRRETTIGTASIEGLVVNLEVAANGRTNWDDFARAEAETPDVPETELQEATKVEVGRVEVSNANISYRDAQAGSNYAISNLLFESDGIGPGDPFDVEAEFDFASQPEDLSGHVAIRGTVAMTEGAAEVAIEGLNVSGELRGMTAQPAVFNFDSRMMSIDTVGEILNGGEMDFTILGVSLSANVEPFSYAGSPQPKAELRVAEFSLKKLLQSLDIEPPATADPAALTRVAFNAKAAVTKDAIRLTSMTLDLDNSTMVGTLSLPLTDSGPVRFDLNVGAINLDGYMAPPDAAAAADADESADDFEIPVDVIRELKADGSLKVGRALLSGLEFTNLELGVRSSNGRLRLNPLAAQVYGGTYSGDIRIDASQDVPSLSVNEKIAGVNLNSLAKAMFDQDNISGTISGSFALKGAGRNLAAIRQDLDGNMSLELKDGAWEGTDIWHQLRTARAIYRRETPPAPTLPARTRFSSLSATGMVTDGIFENNDLKVLLPFLQLTGKGFIDLPAGHVDYAVEARVLNKPELMAGVTQAELDDFTKTVVPVRISGALTAPSVRPDIEAVFRRQVEGALEEQKQQLKKRIFDNLLGGDEKPAVEGEGETKEAEEKDLEEQLKKKLLKDLIGR